MERCAGLRQYLGLTFIKGLFLRTSLLGVSVFMISCAQEQHPVSVTIQIEKSDSFEFESQAIGDAASTPNDTVIINDFPYKVSETGLIKNRSCYVIHVTGSGLIESGTESDKDNSSCSFKPPGLGKIFGPFPYGTSAQIQVPSGPARRFDLLGFINPYPDDPKCEKTFQILREQNKDSNETHVGVKYGEYILDASSRYTTPDASKKYAPQPVHQISVFASNLNNVVDLIPGSNQNVVLKSVNWVESANGARPQQYGCHDELPVPSIERFLPINLEGNVAPIFKIKLQGEARFLPGDILTLHANSNCQGPALHTRDNPIGKESTLGGNALIDGATSAIDTRIVGDKTYSVLLTNPMGTPVCSSLNSTATLRSARYIYDIVAPTIQSRLPSLYPNNTNISLDANVEVVFYENIQIDESKIKFVKNSETNSIPFEISTTDNSIELYPDPNLLYNTNYTVTFELGSIKDLAGNNLIATTWSFTTIPTPDPTPTIALNEDNTSPNNSDRTPKFDISGTFINGDVLKIYNSSGCNGTHEPETLSFTSTSYYADYTLIRNLNDGNHIFSVELIRNSVSYCSEDVVYILDATAPTFSVLSSSNLSISSNVTLNFSESVIIDTETVKIVETSTNLIFESFPINGTGDTFTLNPSQNLHPSTSYKIVFQNPTHIKDSLNNYIGSTPVFFTTAASGIFNTNQIFYKNIGEDDFISEIEFSAQPPNNLELKIFSNESACKLSQNLETTIQSSDIAGTLNLKYEDIELNHFGTYAKLTTSNDSSNCFLISSPEPSEVHKIVYNDETGSWIVGGKFDYIFGEKRRNLALLEITSMNAGVQTVEVHDWNPMPNNTVYALHLDNNKLYAAGKFNALGSDSGTSSRILVTFPITSVDSVVTIGSANTIPLSQFNSETNPIHAIATYDYNIYVGGSGKLVKINSYSTPVSENAINYSGTIYSLVYSDNQIHVGGTNGLEQYYTDLTPVSGVDSGISGTVFDINLNNDILYVSGNFFEKINALDPIDYSLVNTSTINTLVTSNETSIRSISVYNDELNDEQYYFGGTFTSIDTPTHPQSDPNFAVLYDDTFLTLDEDLTSSIDNTVNTTAVSDDYIAIGGEFTNKLILKERPESPTID